MADLGPGTMPRGKYPESPAPAGSHALISRTPIPGGMLHANLGLPTTSPSQLSTSPPATTSKTNPTAPPQCPSRAVASRQRSRNAGGMRRLAAEIPDVFIPLSRNDVRNDDDIFDSDVFPAGDSFTGSPPANTCPRNKPSKQTATTPPTKPTPPRAFQAPMTSWATSMNIAASSPIPMRFMNFISWRSSVRSWAISARSSAMSPRVATCLSNS